jgi:hypothetical protein
MHELAHSAGVHPCHAPDCMNLVPVLLRWTQHLVQPTPSSHHGNTDVLIILGVLSKVTG